MGVPGFFAYLWKKYRKRNFVFNKGMKFKHMHYLVKNNARLYLDTNCAIHPVCFKILSENENFTNYDELHRKMITAVIDYINYLYEFTKPTELFYISIDGVAPSAKLKQQRSRRFKSVKEKKLINNIKKKHNKEIKPFWTNSCISPGTKFMEQLGLKIIEYCEEIKKLNPNLEIIFSSSNTPAEGEHKILQHIRKKPPKNLDNMMIYGLDADLIFLALSTSVPNIYLLRESMDMGGGNATDNVLNYTSIDMMKECIFLEFNSYFSTDTENKIEYDNIKLIDDFIFICYFLGNDFLPNIPSLDIRMYSKKLKNGIDLLIEVYTDIYKEYNNYIVIRYPKIDINLPILIKFISKLAIYEKNFLIEKTKIRKYFRRCESNDPYDKEVHKIQNLQFKIKDPIKLGVGLEKDWKFRYYDHYFHSNFKQQDFIKDICYQYIRGLYWIANYYFDECCSWSWYYPFEHSPLISDLSIHIKTFTSAMIQFDLGEPLEQFEQLLSILPSESSFLLPKELRPLMTEKKSALQHLYPHNYELDCLDKNKYWQTIPNLPIMNIALVKKERNKIKINNKYSNRQLKINPIKI